MPVPVPPFISTNVNLACLWLLRHCCVGGVRGQTRSAALSAAQLNGVALQGRSKGLPPLALKYNLAMQPRNASRSGLHNSNLVAPAVRTRVLARETSARWQLSLRTHHPMLPQ